MEASGRHRNSNGGGCDDFDGCSGHNGAECRRCRLDLGHGGLDDASVGDGGRGHQRRGRHLGAEEVSGERSIDVGVNVAGESSGGFGESCVRSWPCQRQQSVRAYRSPSRTWERGKSDH
jgi:hypothetical protein